MIGSNVSPYLFRLLGAELRVHPTLLIGFALLAVESLPSGQFTATILIAAFALSLLVHETAHLAAAKLFDIRVSDVTIYPFGGVCTLATRPSKLAELVVPCAGILASGAICMAIWMYAGSPASITQWSELSVIHKLLALNLGLVALNLLPVLPLDGGRFLRGGLSLVGTKHPFGLAVTISKIACAACAVLFVLTDQPLVLVAAFVLLWGAIQEHVRTESRQYAGSLRVSDVMIPISRLETFAHGTTVEKAAAVALVSLQPLFPVVISGRPVGIVYRDDLVRRASSSASDYLGALALREIPEVSPEATTQEALSILEETGSPIAFVTSNSELDGMIFQDMLNERLIITALRTTARDNDDTEWSTLP